MRHDRNRSGANGRAARDGFTLLEVLVAVATSLLLVLAISSLFASAGGTIETGRRISGFSRSASIIEQRLREDLSKITREGYLVIRHAVADDGPAPNGTFLPWRVGAFSGDPNARLRRVDELMFFVKNPSVSARAPLAPGFTAEGSAARIYYGHGVLADAPAPDSLLIPEFDMGLSGGTSLQSEIGLLGEPDGPNEFAEDWILLRHQTVLTQARSADQILPATFIDPYDDPQGSDAATLRDQDRQVSMQAALGSIFRPVNYAQRDEMNTEMMREQTEYMRGAWLVQQSNLFDIATTDLREIRSWVMGMHDGPLAADYVPPANDGEALDLVPVTKDDLRGEQDLVDFPVKGYTPFLSPTHIINNPTGDRARLLYDGIHAWMRYGMPTDGGSISATGSRVSDEVEDELGGIRLHAEASPPELLAVLENDAGWGDLEAADRLNDQLMLSASNLGLRVGEFMVEWSFGQTYLNQGNLNDPRNGEIIWYGGHTPIDVDSDGRADNVEFREYRSNQLLNPEQPALAYDRATGAVLERTDGTGTIHIVRDVLIHGARDAGDNRRDNPLYSYFGWDDPTYAPDPSADPSQVASVPWAWPRMLRITISLIDETDPSIEQAFQFVIELDPED